MTTIKKLPTKANFIKGLQAIVPQIKDANVKAEADFILDSYTDNVKDLDKEEIAHMLESLAKVGIEFPTTTGATTKKAPVERSTKKPVAKKESAKETAPKSTDKVATMTSNMTPESDDFFLEKNEYLVSFPQTLVIENLGTMKIRDDIKTLAQLSKEIEQGKRFVFANHWSERALMQFNYDSMGILDNYPQYFPMDLDITYPLHCSDIVCYSISFYTQVTTTYTAHGFSRQDKKAKCRYANGLEYQVYEIVE